MFLIFFFNFYVTELPAEEGESNLEENSDINARILCSGG